jgi:glyoxylase-like metal-dependent hydrolase (beta-lactamase superfamily II)
MRRTGIFPKQIQKANIKLSEISHIILTHHHDDHCGLLYNILKENPSIHVVMSHLCKDLISKGENDHTNGGRAAK